MKSITKQIIYIFFLSVAYCDEGFDVKNTKNVSQNEFFVISLGSNCFPALHAKHHGLRVQGFPFDWNVTSFKSLISVINSDFKDFCELDCLRIINRAISDAVVNEKYDFVIHHTFQQEDWDNDSDRRLMPLNEKAVESFKGIKSRFERRIDRFNKIMNSGDLVYLLRFEDIDLAKADQLYDVLKEKYPLSNFILVCLDEWYLEGINTWESPNEKILHFHLNPTNRSLVDSTYEHPNQHFTELFTQLGLVNRS